MTIPSSEAVSPGARASVRVVSGDDLHRGGAAPGVFRRAVATVEVAAAPRAEQLDNLGGADPHATLLRAARAMISTLSNLPSRCALELRYVAGDGRLRMFVTARVDDQAPSIAALVLDAALACLPPQFGFLPAAVPDAPEGQVVTELRRDIRFEPPTYRYVVSRHGLEAIPVIADRPGDASGWARFLRVLLDAAPAQVSVVFKPIQLADYETDALAHLLGVLTLTAQPHEDIDIIRRPVLMPADPACAAALPNWQARSSGLLRPLLFKVAVRADPSRALGVATALASHLALSADEATAPLQVVVPDSERDFLLGHASFELLECARWQSHPGWRSPAAPSALERMAYLATLDEAASLALLPVPGALGVAGMPEAEADRLVPPAPAPHVVGSGVVFGVQASGASRTVVSSAVDNLTRHTLVVGSSGAGKTTTVHSLLWRLWVEHQVPWLVIEPAKREYRALALPLDGARVFTVGRDDLRPLGLNLLCPPPGVRCQQHISSLMAAFKLALPLFQPLPALLEQALEETFSDAGWRLTDTTAAGHRVPRLGDLTAAFDTVFSRYPYRGEAQNLAIALRLRLDSLARGSRGSVFASGQTPISELLEGPCVVELSAVADPEDKMLNSALLVQLVRVHAEQRGATRRLQHVTVIEEAHHLLKAQQTGRDAESGARTDADSVAMLCEAISELRGVGEGFVLSTQFPSQLAEEAVANTATKVVHRLEREPDRRAVLEDLGAPPELSSALGRLRPGAALFRGLESPSPLVIDVVAPDGIDTARSVPDERLASPAIPCGGPGCLSCDVGTAAAGKRLAQSSSHLGRLLDGSADGVRAASRELCARTTDQDAARCALVHLNAGL